MSAPRIRSKSGQSVASDRPALGQGKAGDGSGVRQGELRLRMGERRRQHVGLRADDEARATGEALGKRFGRGEERRLITFANCAKPVAEMRVDRGNDQPIGDVRLGKQG